jgi:hypothetical protein
LRKYRDLLFFKYSYIYEDRSYDSDAERIERAIAIIDAVQLDVLVDGHGQRSFVQAAKRVREHDQLQSAAVSNLQTYVYAQQMVDDTADAIDHAKNVLRAS